MKNIRKDLKFERVREISVAELRIEMRDSVERDRKNMFSFLISLTNICIFIVSLTTSRLLFCPSILVFILLPYTIYYNYIIALPSS